MAASGKGSALTGLLLARRRRRRRGAVDLLVRSKVGDAAPAVFDDLIFSVTPPTLYYVVYPSAESEPSAAQIKAGQKQSGAAATASGSETARTTTGEEVFAAAAGGLSGATSYRVALVWSDGTNDSNVVVSSAWATWNSGSLAASESGADTASIAGDVLVAGSLAATESGADVAAFAGDVLVSGALAAIESGADTAAIVGAVRVTGTLAATESGQDTAHFTSQSVAIGSLTAVETGGDTAAFAGTVLVSGHIAANESPDTAAFTGTVEGAAPGVTPAGKSGRGKRRRIVIRERVYEVPERDIPALLEAELLDRAPPVTADVVAGPKPPRKRRKSAPQPVKTVEQVQEAVAEIRSRIGPDDAWLMQALETVAQRVLERLQDEEDSLMLLLAA